MPIYMGEWPGPAEWNVAATIELEPDGRFSYSEYWTCYMATSGGDVHGRWSRQGDALLLHPERMDGATTVRMEPGTDVIAAIVGETVNLGSGCMLSLPVIKPADAVKPVATEAPKATAPRIAHVTAAPLRAVMQPVVTAPTAAPVISPSAEMSARIESLIDDLPVSGVSLNQLCRELNALPLHADDIYLWALRPDGVLLCIDHESFRRDAEPETDPLRAYTALVAGSQRYPELVELIPDTPPT